MSHSLSSVKGGVQGYIYIYGTTIGDIKEDTRSLDYGSSRSSVRICGTEHACLQEDMWGLGIRFHGLQKKLGVYLGVHVTGSMLFGDDASGIYLGKLPYHTKAQSLIRTNACGWQAGSWTNKGHGN